MIIHQPPDHPSHTFELYVVWEPRCNLILHIHVVINWQLSKQGIWWPVSPDHTEGSGIDHWGGVFFEVLRWQVTSFQMIPLSSSIFLKCVGSKLCLWATLLKFWFQTDLGCKNSASRYRHGRQLLLTFLTMVTHWSCSTSNFYVPISGLWIYVENLCYIWKRCLLIAEGDRVLCHLVMFFTLFPLDVQNEIHLPSRFFCYSWLICLLEVEKWASCQSNRKSISFNFFSKRVESLKWFWRYLMAFRSCIWTGKRD